ncbi:hypothetical protein B0H21DRAFT_839111 [Amylocystis lapponica]|nr:hypothetical protein B0H21DRAFT_839111 [Amylocystis lapponica]
MSAPAQVASLQQLNETFGVLLIGFVFAVSLYGLTFFQSYVYFSRFPADPVWSKYSVGVLWALDTATTTLLSQTMYNYLITSFLKPFDMLPVTSTFVAETALAAFGIFVVQTFYAFRIRTIKQGNPSTSILICTMALASLALGIAATVEISKQPLFYDFTTPTVKILLGAQYGLLTLCDLIVVVSLFSLLQPERHPGMAIYTSTFDYGVVCFLNRGTAFTILQIASLVVFLTAPSHQVWILFHFVTSKVYINSLLAMLNVRDAFRGRGMNEEDSTSQSQSKSASGGVQLSVIDTQTKRNTAMTIDLGPVQSRDGADDEDEEAHKSDTEVLERASRKSGSAY